MDIFAQQEGHHGVMMDEILKKAGQPVESVVPEGQKVYVCPVCGYEYIGDIGAEPEEFTCPLCGQPKKVFKER